MDLYIYRSMGEVLDPSLTSLIVSVHVYLLKYWRPEISRGGGQSRSGVGVWGVWGGGVCGGGTIPEA